MKKTMFFAALAAMFTLASCQKEAIVEEESDKPVVESPVFTATISEGAKTTINVSDGKVTWESADEITIEDSAHTKSVYKIKSIVDGKATFVIKAGQPALGAGPYTATYGAAPEPHQTYSETAGKLYMEAPSTSDYNLHFDVKCGLMKLNLTKGGQSVKTILVSGTVKDKEDNISATYTLTCSTAQSIASAKDFYIALPAGSYTQIDIYNQDHKVCTKVASSGLVIETNHIKPVTFGESKLNFEPEIHPIVDTDHRPLTSYDYYTGTYVTKNVSTANSDFFLTDGLANTISSSETYDEEALGIFTGTVEDGMAKLSNFPAVDFNPGDYTVTDYGYYYPQAHFDSKGNLIIESTKVSTKGSASDQTLTQEFTWRICGNKDIVLPAGTRQITPYIKAKKGSAAAVEYKGAPYDVVITGLPHISGHKDLWYIAKQRTAQQATSGKVSGEVIRRTDDNNYKVDMFYSNRNTHWNDFAIMSRGFSIPADATIKVKPRMHGVLWGGQDDWWSGQHEMNAYFFVDAVPGGKDSEGNVNFKLYPEKKPSESTHKLDSGSGYHVCIENKTATGDKYEYYEPTGSFDFTSTNNHMNVYILIYRNFLTNVLDYPGFWMHDISVVYAE